MVAVRGPRAKTRRTACRIYDASGRNTGSIDAIGATTLQRFTYTFDANGNRDSMKDLGGPEQIYTYDQKDRLIEASIAESVEVVYAYTWDSRDNLLTSDETGTQATHTYDAASRLTNTVEGSDSTDYTYDNNGNLQDVSGPTSVAFEYTRENQLLDVKGDAEASYVYDCFGHRRQDTVSGETLELYWHDGNYLGERNAYVSTGVLSKLFATTNGEITGKVEGAIEPLSALESFDYLSDFLGSITGEVNGLASVTSVRRYKPSGEKYSGALVFRGPGFTGASGSRHTMVPFAEQDNHWRNYSTRLMQWITRDTLWPAELPYVYVSGTPTAFIDPHGLLPTHNTPPQAPQESCRQAAGCITAGVRSGKSISRVCADCLKRFPCHIPCHLMNPNRPRPNASPGFPGSPLPGPYAPPFKTCLSLLEPKLVPETGDIAQFFHCVLEKIKRKPGGDRHKMAAECAAEFLKGLSDEDNAILACCALYGRVSKNGLVGNPCTGNPEEDEVNGCCHIRHCACMYVNAKDKWQWKACRLVPSQMYYACATQAQRECGSDFFMGIGITPWLPYGSH